MKTTLSIVRFAEDLSAQLVETRVWLEFLEQRVPLPATEPGRLCVILAEHGGDGLTCLRLEGGTWRLDDAGYLLDHPPPVVPIRSLGVIDAQHLFNRRRNRREHGWQPAPELCAAAIELIRRQFSPLQGVRDEPAPPDYF